MSTIILASSGAYITEGDLSFLTKPINQMKIAWIVTASKGVTDLSYLDRHRERMNELGYDYEKIDIDGKNESELRDLLKNKDLVFVEGGNSFYLLKAIRQSHFDIVIRDLIDHGVVYIGSSAGAYVACPTIEMSAWRHDRYSHYDLKDLTGMGLVPFIVTVHYDPKSKEILREKIRESKYPVKVLTDDQAMLVQDEAIRLIGKGEEIVL
ncbi:MAG: Type 1 glutamine amidotransferase-like domain-containing protein [Candidatus Komeilibacteria bacterium]